MSEDLDTVFIQHKIDVHEKVTEWLYENDFVAIHYENTPVSADPSEYRKHHVDSDDDFDTLANKVEVLLKWDKKGKIVGADYGGSNVQFNGGMKVGLIKPDDNPSITILGFRGTDYIGRVEVPKGTSEAEIIERASGDLKDILKNSDNEDIRILKSIQIDESRWIWYRDYPVLGARGRLPTLCTWNDGDKIELRAAYEEVDSLLDIASNDIDYERKARLLSPGQLEVLCNEYLRSEYGNYLQQYSLGGSTNKELPDVDILAESHPDRTDIVAQVTHEQNASKLEDKLEKLAAYATPKEENTRLLFFGPDHKEADITVPDHIEYRPNGRVFKSIEKSKPELLEAMLSVPSKEETTPPN